MYIYVHVCSGSGSLAEEDGRGGEFTGPSANGSVGDFVAGPGAVGGSLECGAII